jgi:hypothetical protein
VSLSAAGDTLWFSSKGHNTIGGFDIFFSVRKQDGSWGQAINAGYPLNTSWDELFHRTASSSAGIFYFASNRSGGFGGLDIYKGSSLPLIHEEKPEMYQPPADSPEKDDDPDENQRYFVRED